MHRLHRYWPLFAITLALGCSALPEVAYQPSYHNPFPQLYRVAVLPFYNQSGEPTVNQDEIAIAYYNELQRIPGFEVMPVGVARQAVAAMAVEPQSAEEFQLLAQRLGVDAVVVGSVTEYSPYYPPRLGLAVAWYAANPCFHEIPPGYGLPWGTPDEQRIPRELVREAEFTRVREELTAAAPHPAGPAPPWADCPARSLAAGPATCEPHSGPVISHTRLYDGADSRLTRRLADYYRARDDVRAGGWHGYLQRSDDFVRFCCYLHITETLAARGGVDETRVAWRWPIGRYQR